MNLLKTALIAVSFIVYPLSYAQDEIGVAAAVNTKTVDMVAYPGGNIENRNVDPGYKIISNRTIQTNKSGKAQMLLVDGTAFTIGPNSRVTLDKFIYDPATASGSLEVSAKGLVRLVGGKVTKKRPAIIKTSTATVGIRGGIAIVEASSEETKASFVYGVEMEVAPIENPDNSLVLTQVGLSVEVEAGSDEVEDPEVLTSEELDNYSDDFEGNEEPENEESDEESASEESSEDSESDTEESDESELEESEESEESEGDESESEETEETEESEDSEESESEESENEGSEESDSEESDETEAEESEESDNEESDSDELEDSEETEESNEAEESDETDNEESDQTDSEEADTSDNSNEDSAEEDSSGEQGSDESSEAESSESENDTQTSDSSEELDQDSEDEQSPQTEESTGNEETSPDTSNQDDEIVETDSPEEDSSVNGDSDVSDNTSNEQNADSDSLESSDDVSQDESSSPVVTNDASNADEENPLINSSNNDTSVNNSSGQDNNENSDAPLVVTSSSSSEDTPPVIQTDDEKAIEDKPVVQPPVSTSSSDSVTLTQPSTSTSSSDSVTLTQPPVSTSSSDSVPLTQPPVSSSASDLITIEPSNEDPEPVIPEIDESLLDNFDISKNTSDTGIDNLTTAYDQGGELFIDDTQIESQEEEFIEEANEANEEVQVEEVQQETKVEAVVEAQLSTETFFLTSEIAENTSPGASLGRIEAEYTGASDLRFAIAGPGSENFKIDETGNITLEKELDYEKDKTYNLFVFTFLGEKSITNKLDLNVIDIDEEPLVNVGMMTTSLNEDFETSKKIAEIEVLDPENNGIQISVTGIDSEKVSVSNSNEIILNKSLDFEQKEDLEFIVEVFDGKNTVRTPLKYEVNNINDLAASVNLTNTSVHEGSQLNSNVGSIILNDQNSEYTYTLSGSDSDDFKISSSGTILINNELDFTTRNSYDLSVNISGKNDSINIPLNIEIAKNIDPNFIAACNDSCAFKENSAVGTSVIQSTRTDDDVDIATFSLENNFNNQFAINSSTGEVKINTELDFEQTDSFDLKIIATDSKGVTKEVDHTLNVLDVAYLEDSIQSNKKVSAKPSSFLALSGNENYLMIDEDLASEADPAKRKIATFDTTISGTTYSLSGPGSSYMEIGSDGVLTFKSGADFSVAESSDITPGTGILLNVNANIPNEGVEQKQYKLIAKNIERHENLVIKVASDFHNVSHDKVNNPFSAKAIRGELGNTSQVITESTLKVEEVDNNVFLNSVDDRNYVDVDTKTVYLANSVDNGKNENNSEILDFEYQFPIDKTSGDDTYRLYAPMSSPNAKWDTERSGNEEIAKYQCYDSGQGCGSGTSQLVIDGNWREGTQGEFLGYNIKEFNSDTNYLLNSNLDGGSAGNGTGFNTLIHSDSSVSSDVNSHAMNGGESEFQVVSLPSSFNYFGTEFSKLHINENGFITLSNSHTPAWDNARASNLRHGGAVPFMYLDQDKHFQGGIDSEWPQWPESYPVNSLYGIPSSDKEGILDNSIFALWAAYNTEQYNGSPNFNIRTLWNSSTQIFTVGWYNHTSGESINDQEEANFEIQFNLNNDSFRIVHGQLGSNFLQPQPNNAMVGFTKDISCLTLNEDISNCEGKDYVQLYFHDGHFGPMSNPTNDANPFQNPRGNNLPYLINHMFNENFNNNQTVNNSNYCYVIDINGTCQSSYGWTQAKADNDGKLWIVTPNNVSDIPVLEKSEINQAYRSGLSSEFIWMHLNKSPSVISYTPPEDNANGFSVGANSRPDINTGALSAGDEVSSRTFKDEIIIAGEVYKNSELDEFLGDTKKVIAYAPIPILHSNRYEKDEYSAFSDLRFRRVHTIMPNFISIDFMEDKDNGTDKLFDFHQIRDNDYCKHSLNCISYRTSGGSTFDTQDSNLSNKTNSHAAGLYGYASKVLDNNIHVSSQRFGNLTSSQDHIPYGQSLWYQVFNPNGRGVGLYAQLNWSCGNLGKCSTDGASPHDNQHSLFSVLISESGDKSDFYALGEYSLASTGQVVMGDHYWSYLRRSGKSTQKDGIYATNSQTPQISFGINPIACISGPDNGCFFGNNTQINSSAFGAPSTAIISTDDPCGNFNNSMNCNASANKIMDLGVMYSMEENSSEQSSNLIYKTETFYQGIAQQKQFNGSSFVDSINLNGADSWRSEISTSDNLWIGALSGFWTTDRDSSTRSHPQYLKSPLRISFDETNDRVVASATSVSILNKIAASSDQNGENDWYHYQGSHSGDNPNLLEVPESAQNTLQFGDEDSSKNNQDFARSAYINKKTFGAILKNQNKNISSQGKLNTTSTVDNAGALISWDTIDEKDTDFILNENEPSLEYMSWGLWAMATSDGLEYLSGIQPSAVHMGTWYAGDLLDISDWPIDRVASLSGMAMMNMFALIENGGVSQSYSWIEGSKASGEITFDGLGDYVGSITVHDLGKGNCETYCGSGFTSGMLSGALGDLVWQFDANMGNNIISSQNVITRNSGGNKITEIYDLKGHLFGTSSHMEMGADLQFSRENNKELIMMTGSAILSE